MKQKTIQRTKQTINQKVDRKINQLIKNIKDIKKIEKVFKATQLKLVEEIIDLRRIHNADYNFGDLLQEDKLIDVSDEVEMYVPYKELSVRTAKLYTDGKLNNTEAMVLANLPKPFLTPDRQEKIAIKFLNNEVKAKELIYKSRSELYELINEKGNALNEELKIILESVYMIDRCARVINKHKKVIKKSPYLKNIKENFFHLKNAIQFGLGIKLK